MCWVLPKRQSHMWVALNRPLLSHRHATAAPNVYVEGSVPWMSVTSP